MLAQKLQTPIAVLLGGNSAERTVSLESGEAVFQALLTKGFAAEKFDTSDESWFETVTQNYQHTFIALHGGDGEDGTVQQALEQAGISYTGSGVTASAMAMDKVRCKQLWQQIGLATPQFVELTAASDWSAIINQWGKMIVKPATEGSSIGMTIAITAEELEAAFKAAAQFDSHVMAEQWVTGAEFTVAILGGRALPPIRLETDHGFYDYDAKYLADDTRYICPCGLSTERENELKTLALAAFDSVGCEGWGRVDVMQNQDGEFFLLEVNTVPGMTSHSLVPMAANAAGLSFSDLVEEIVSLSLQGRDR